MVMDPLEAINGVAAGIQGGLQYLQNNAWAMMFLFIVGYVIKTNGLDPYLRNRQYRPDAVREVDFHDDLRRIRLQQQQQANIRAVEAAKEHQEKERKEKTRKNQLFDPKKQGGTTLGRTSDNDYSPMQPWSGSTKSYKPTTRIVKRG